MNQEIFNRFKSLDRNSN